MGGIGFDKTNQTYKKSIFSLKLPNTQVTPCINLTLSFIGRV